MAKRKRRKTRSTRTTPVARQATAAAQPAVKTAAPAHSDVNLVEEYSYVYAEMRTMFIVTLLMVVLIVGLAYVI